MPAIENGNGALPGETPRKEMDHASLAGNSPGVQEDGTRNVKDDIAGQPPDCHSEAAMEIDNEEEVLEYLQGWRLRTLTFACGRPQ